MKKTLKWVTAIGIALAFLVATVFVFEMQVSAWQTMPNSDSGIERLFQGMGFSIFAYSFVVLLILAAFGIFCDLRALLFGKALSPWRWLCLCGSFGVLALFYFSDYAKGVVLWREAVLLLAVTVVLRLTVARKEEPLPRARSMGLVGLWSFAAVTWLIAIFVPAIWIIEEWWEVFLSPFCLWSILSLLYVWGDLLLALRTWLSGEEPVKNRFAAVRFVYDFALLFFIGLSTGRVFFQLMVVNAKVYAAMLPFGLAGIIGSLLIRGAGRLIFYLKQQAFLVPTVPKQKPLVGFLRKHFYVFGIIGSLILVALAAYLLYVQGVSVQKGLAMVAFAVNLLLYWWCGLVAFRFFVQTNTPALRGAYGFAMGICLLSLLTMRFYHNVLFWNVSYLRTAVALSLFSLSLWLDFQESKGIKAALEGAEPPEEKTK